MIRIITAGALLGFIVELILAQRSSSFVKYFPPLFPHLIALALLTAVALAWGRPGWLRRTVATIGVIALLSVGAFAYSFGGFSNSRPAAVCSYTYSILLPEDHPARSVGLGEALGHVPEIDISWPGEYTCTWPPESGEEDKVTYTTSLLASASIMATLWS